MAQYHIALNDEILKDSQHDPRRCACVAGAKT